MAKGPWKSEEWKERREEVVGEKCVQCGSTQNLNVHHLKRRRTYQDISSRVFYALYNELKEQGKLPLELIEITYKDVCPKCSKTNIRLRKTMLPRYRCPMCKTNFDEPAKKEYRNEKLVMSYVGKNYQKELKERIEAIRKKENEEYLKTDKVITLCRKCHYLNHQGKKLCRVCKENYHEIQYEMCWNCNVNNNKKRGRILCKFCERKFHDENQKACSECSFMRTEFKCSVCGKIIFDAFHICFDCDEGYMCSECASKHDKQPNHNTSNFL